MEISNEYLPHYANLFNRSQIINFVKKIEAKNIKELLEASKVNLDRVSKLSYLELYETLYSVLKKEYRCEYVYLNEIFLNEVLKSHDEDCAIITEFNVNNSKVDLLVINGTTTAYEIKTELDTFVRLEKQLLDYTKAFDKVYVITCLEFADKIIKKLEKNELLRKIGIKILKKDGSLETLKKSKSFINNFDREIIFNCLIKKEREVFGKTEYESKEKFLKRSNKTIHKHFKNFLFERQSKKDFVESLPESLKMVGYKIEKSLNKTQKARFINKLNNKIKI